MNPTDPETFKPWLSEDQMAEARERYQDKDALDAWVLEQHEAGRPGEMVLQFRDWIMQQANYWRKRSTAGVGGHRWKWEVRFEDWVDIGIEAATKAMSAYDAERGRPSTWVMKRIQWAMMGKYYYGLKKMNNGGTPAEIPLSVLQGMFDHDEPMPDDKDAILAYEPVDKLAEEESLAALLERIRSVAQEDDADLFIAHLRGDLQLTRGKRYKLKTPETVTPRDDGISTQALSMRFRKYKERLREQLAEV